MKISVIGGGGVRSPFLAKSLANCARQNGISEIVFMDNNKDKINIYGKLAQKVAQSIDSSLKFSITTSLQDAVNDTDYIITTIRTGCDKARIDDEKIPLKYGVLGQETTGAGGFGMALRTIPDIIEIVKAIEKYAKKDAVLLNFTNPSGLVTQAIRNYGFDRIYGICDAPSGETKEIQHLMGYDNMSYECYGLNHLSFWRKFMVNGKDVTSEILSSSKVKDSVHRFFEDDLLSLHNNEVLNEYLYLFYYRQKAVDAILKHGETRGEAILKINEDMNNSLKDMNIDDNFEKYLETWLAKYLVRQNSYMQVESKTNAIQIKVPSAKEFLESNLGDDGYAGVAIDFIKAKRNGIVSNVVLSVPNEGAIDGIATTDVVEITCILDKNGVKPIKIGKVNDFQYSLISRVKFYERLAAEAILEKSKAKALQALTAHPLVNSFDIAKNILNDYLSVHKQYTGEWK